MATLRNTSGIYQIRNTVTGDCYIGSSEHIGIRWALHRSQLRKHKHHAIYLQRAWNKYGAESFEFGVLEVVETSQLLAREQFYLDTQHPVYNSAAEAAAAQRGRIRTPEQRAAIGAKAKARWAAMTPEQRQAATAGAHAATSERNRQNWAAWTPEQKQALLDKAHAGSTRFLKERWDRLTEEERSALTAAMREVQPEAARRYWAKWTPDARRVYMRSLLGKDGEVDG